MEVERRHTDLLRYAHAGTLQPQQDAVRIAAGKHDVGPLRTKPLEEDGLRQILRDQGERSRPARGISVLDEETGEPLFFDAFHHGSLQRESDPPVPAPAALLNVEAHRLA